jgi:hypothetical protein
MEILIENDFQDRDGAKKTRDGVSVGLMRARTSEEDPTIIMA